VAGIIAAIDNLGFASGSRIICYLDDVYEAVHLAITCAHSGVTAVPLDPRSSRDAVCRLIERTEAIAVYTRVDHVAALGPLPVPTLVWTTGAAPAGTTNLRGQLPSLGDALRMLRSRAAGADSLYIIQPTSGTTGEPKLMRRTQRPFLRIGRLWRFPEIARGAQQRRLMANPLTHGAGVLDLWAGIATRSELCIPSRPNVETALEEVRALDPHVLVLVPRILRSLHRQQLAANEPAGTRLLGPSAELFAFGGAPCEAELQDLVRAQGVEVREIYGTSETGILVMTPAGEARPGWSGRPFDDVELKLDLDGELLARTPCMMEGYLGNEELSREATDDEGFYRTGDFAEIDAGWVRVIGRKKDVFNTPTGNNIFPSRIEGMLEQLPSVQQAIVIGDGRPYLVALVALEDLARAADLGDHVRELNRTLESEERVRRLAVLDAPLGAELYRPVGHGKVRRERAKIDDQLATLIAAIYAPSPVHPAVQVVEP
jgi:long-chain acyl-CoA synthetase